MGANIYEQVMEVIGKGERISLLTKFAGEEGSLKEDLTRSLEAVQAVPARKGGMVAPVICEEEEGAVTVCEPIYPRERLLILGGGHVALALAEMAAKCDFRVTVCDDRPAFANEERFPWAEEILCDTFENCLEKFAITSYDYVVIVTRGHVHDGDCLRVILKGVEPAYTGLIGSRRRVRGLFDQLESEGFSRERMDKICTPIGLNIGGITPQEIAVSIMAELISYRRLPEHTQGRPMNTSDLTLDMIEYLAKDKSPKAIVTVIQTKGSTPRGAGAKMTVGPRGEIVGTIGGGCSEGAIIRDAIDIIGTGTYRVCFVDMTGEVAEEEGMVCGGWMKVLLEDGSSHE